MKEKPMVSAVLSMGSSLRVPDIKEKPTDRKALSVATIFLTARGQPRVLIHKPKF